MMRATDFRRLARRARRGRLIGRIGAGPDGNVRWLIFVEQLGRRFDADDEIDRLLGEAVEAAAGAVELFAASIQSAQPAQ